MNNTRLSYLLPHLQKLILPKDLYATIKSQMTLL